MNLNLTFTAELAPPEPDDTGRPRRELVGLAAPYGTVGRTSAGPVMFQRGAFDPDARPPLFRDHDRTRPIGVVVALEDTPAGLVARCKVSRTPAGDEALELAADGALTGLSVGVEVVAGDLVPAELDGTAGDVLLVTAARFRELSLVAFPAFDTATVHQVAAMIPNTQEEPAVTPTDTLPDVVAAEVIPTAELRLAPTFTRPELTAGQVAHVMLLAQRGDQRASELLAELDPPAGPASVYAALTGETTTTSDGIVPPSYSSTILGGLPVATPFVSNLIRRAGLPATGMAIVKPEWATVPEGDWVAAENAQAPTSPATITNRTVAVLTYAHAILASLNLVNRSDFGGYTQAYYSQIGIDYLAKKEAKAVATALAAATTVASAGTTPAAIIGDLVAAQVAAQTTAGEFRGLMPEYAAVSADVWAELVETKVPDGPAFSSGSIEWGRLTGNLSGLIVVMVPALPVRTYLVGARAATVMQDDSELQLRALVVNTLSVELGVIGNAAFDVEYPAALVKHTAPAPTAARGK
jgi:HK97 family phage prohead protease